MTGWKVKRFWTAAEVEELPDGFTVRLDTRPVKTPAKQPLVVPTRDMATAIAAEWQAQTRDIDPLSMPVTRGANAAIDKVGPQRSEVIDLLAAYGDSDLLCYRAAGPDELVALQGANWDPPLDWARKTLGVRLAVGAGVMHLPQPPESLARLRAMLDAESDFALAGLHDLISLSGSLVLALAVSTGHLPPEEAWRLSRTDEDWQITQWGEDDEAAATAAIKRQAFLAAARFVSLSRPA